MSKIKERDVNVKELIEQLEELDEDLLVVVEDEALRHEAFKVYQFEGSENYDPVVVIQTCFL